jgi:hypothetical protein
MRPLQERHYDALLKVRGGADVFDWGLACDLREVEQRHPDWIYIGRAEGDYGKGDKREPYFGAQATASGRQALKDWRNAKLLAAAHGHKLVEQEFIRS